MQHFSIKGSAAGDGKCPRQAATLGQVCPRGSGKRGWERKVEKAERPWQLRFQQPAYLAERRAFGPTTQRGGSGNRPPFVALATRRTGSRGTKLRFGLGFGESCHVATEGRSDSDPDAFITLRE
jgi:hypothetical protein